MKAQIRYAIIARVLRGIERAKAHQDCQAAFKTCEIIGRLEYLHYEGGCIYDLDTLVGGAK